MKNIILVISIIFLFSACWEDSTSPYIEASNKDVLIPLKVGNTWTYNYEIDDGVLNQKTSMTTEVISEFIYNGEKHYRMQHINNSTNQVLSNKFYMINKPDGYYMINDSGRTEPEIIKLNYPTFKGEVIVEEEYYKLYVEDTEYIYTTPMGKFKCIKYVVLHRYGDVIDAKAENYYAPGIGEVASEYYRNKNNSGVLTLSNKMVLTSYSLK